MIISRGVDSSSRGPVDVAMAQNLLGTLLNQLAKLGVQGFRFRPNTAHDISISSAASSQDEVAYQLVHGLSISLVAS